MFCACGSPAKRYGRYCPAEEQRWRCTDCGRIFSQARNQSGNNFLRGQQRSHLKRLLVAGVPHRAAAREVGISTQTVIRYFRLWRITAKCPCGQPSTHQGFCSWRLSMCPQRQSWLDQCWSRRVHTNIAALVREGTKRAQAQGHQIGTWVWGADGNAGLWPYTKCRVCGCGLSISGYPAFGGEPSVEGKALVTKCVPPHIAAAQQAERRQRRQEKRLWDEGRKTLSQLKKILRDPSNSPSVASTPGRTSRRS